MGAWRFYVPHLAGAWRFGCPALRKPLSPTSIRAGSIPLTTGRMGRKGQHIAIRVEGPVNPEVAARLGSLTADGCNPPWDTLPAERRADQPALEQDREHGQRRERGQRQQGQRQPGRGDVEQQGAVPQPDERDRDQRRGDEEILKAHDQQAGDARERK